MRRILEARRHEENLSTDRWTYCRRHGGTSAPVAGSLRRAGTLAEETTMVGIKVVATLVRCAVDLLCDDIDSDHLRFTDAEGRMQKRVAGDHQRVSAPGRTRRGHDGTLPLPARPETGNDARPLHQAGRGTAAAAGTNVIAPSAPKGRSLTRTFFASTAVLPSVFIG
jgi:hypothetical protein